MVLFSGRKSILFYDPTDRTFSEQSYENIPQNGGTVKIINFWTLIYSCVVTNEHLKRRLINVLFLFMALLS